MEAQSKLELAEAFGQRPAAAFPHMASRVPVGWLCMTVYRLAFPTGAPIVSAFDAKDGSRLHLPVTNRTLAAEFKRLHNCALAVLLVSDSLVQNRRTAAQST